MNLVDEITRQIMLEDIHNLPARLTPKDIYNYYNKDRKEGEPALVGRDRAYEIAKKIGYRFREGGKIFVNKTDFIKYLYGGGEPE